MRIPHEERYMVGWDEDSELKSDVFKYLGQALFRVKQMTDEVRLTAFIEDRWDTEKGIPAYPPKDQRFPRNN